MKLPSELYNTVTKQIITHEKGFCSKLFSIAMI